LCIENVKFRSLGQRRDTSHTGRPVTNILSGIGFFGIEHVIAILVYADFDLGTASRTMTIENGQRFSYHQGGSASRTRRALTNVDARPIFTSNRRNTINRCYRTARSICSISNDDTSPVVARNLLYAVDDPNATTLTIRSRRYG
jgi:hypothetical protein